MDHQRKKFSVLFVDDEPAILRLLASLMMDMHQQWRMECAPSAAIG